MSTQERFTSLLGPTISRYLALKRALGRAYTNETRILRSLDGFLDNLDPSNSDLTHETFQNWCRTVQHLAPGVRRDRMRVIRNLCLYRLRAEPACFVPDPVLFPPRHQPVQPYIFSEAEVARVIATAGTLERFREVPMRPEMFRLAIVLLYTTGLRRGELLRMTIADYSPQEQTLWVRQTKFHKERYLPLSNDGVREIERYLRASRLHKVRIFPEMPLVWSGHGRLRHYSGHGFGRVIHQLFKLAGIHKPDNRPPRVHDLRFTFAVHALLRWYRLGFDVQAKLPLLATYMGHVSIVSTQYYLPFVESLLEATSTLFASRYGKLIVPVAAERGGDR